MSALLPIATTKADSRKRSCPLYPRLCCKTRRQTWVEAGCSFLRCPGRPLVLRGALPRIGSTTGGLRETNSTPQRRWTTDELGKAPQVLRDSGEQDLVPRAAQTAQSKSIEPEDALHMVKPHLDLLALPT